MFETDDGLTITCPFTFSDVVGRVILCEDGISRRVESIGYSHKFADKILINELDEDDTPGGSWVHVLSLSAQMTGEPAPTEDKKKAFSRMASALRFQPERDQRSGMIKLPSGLLV